MTSLVDLRGADALVIVGDSERNADLFWATGFRAPDPFYFVATTDDAYVVVKDLELDRARAQVRGAAVLAASQYESWHGEREAPPGGALGEVLRDLSLLRLLVPADFAVHTADDLRAAGFRVEVAPTPLFPQRARKTAAEIAAIAAAQAAAEAAMAAAVTMIGRAEVRGDGLVLDGELLTSAAVRRRIHHTLLDLDCSADHTIVAGGEQGVDPHEAGHGPLPAHRPIVLDIFPRGPTGYFGDITRTVVRGRVDARVQHLYDTVTSAQLLALARIAAGVDGAEVHRAVVAHVADAGYETGQVGGRMQGFFHGTGHGVGLQIHEAPSLSKRPCTLEAGHTVTVEPGLYYPGIGGARIEDLVVVVETGCRNLTSFPRVLSL